MNRPYEYRFPEKDAFRAMEVTEPEFDILSRPEYEHLYVDFSAVRSEVQFEQMNFMLGMRDGALVSPPNTYHKIIFSGHRGCGKTIELQRYTRSIDRPEAYMALYIDLESETEIQHFEIEDLYILLITVLLRELDKRKIPIEKDDFEQIANEWIEEGELLRELQKEYGMEAEAGISLAWKFWTFMGLEGRFKGIFSQKNKTSQVIRSKIRIDQKNLVNKFNVALITLRDTLLHYNKGKGLLFVVDGLEKARPEVYDMLFVRDPQLISSLHAHIVSCVPIRTFYEIQRKDISGLFEPVYLPMIRISDESRGYLQEMIARRIDLALFHAGVLDKMIDMSGGCPRQLLRLVHRSIIVALGKPVSDDVAARTFNEQGIERWRTLTRAHKDLIESGAFDDADPLVLDLLFSLNLLEYNGQNPDRKINPLIAHYFQQPES